MNGVFFASNRAGLWNKYLKTRSASNTNEAFKKENEADSVLDTSVL